MGEAARTAKAGTPVDGPFGQSAAPAARTSGGHTPERRRHRVYVTRNTEYHFRDGFCVAVRDRRSGDFLNGHLAIQRRLHGGLKFFPNGAIVPNAGDPGPGEALYFAAEGRDLVTSPVERVERPAKIVVESYPPPPAPPGAPPASPKSR